MKISKNLVVFLFVMSILFTACQTQRQVVKNTQSTNSQVKESKVFYRDTVLYTPKSKTHIILPISDIKKEAKMEERLKKTSAAKVYRQKNGNAIATVKIIHDTLTVSAECDSLAIVAKIKQQYDKEYFENTKTSDQLIEKKSISCKRLFILMVLAFLLGLLIKTVIKNLRS